MPTLSVQRAVDGHSQAVDVLGSEIGQIPVLGMRPSSLDRIEFGRVRRKVLDANRITGLAQSLLGRLVNAGTIPDELQLVLQVPLKVADEGDDLTRPDVVRMDLEIEPKSPSLGRQSDCTDH